jgi:hypothetical protein
MTADIVLFPGMTLNGDPTIEHGQTQRYEMPLDLRFYNGRLQQRWLVTIIGPTAYENSSEWRDVPRIDDPGAA